MDLDGAYGIYIYLNLYTYIYIYIYGFTVYDLNSCQMVF